MSFRLQVVSNNFRLQISDSRIDFYLFRTCFGPNVGDCETCQSQFALYPHNGSCTSCCGANQTSEKCCDCDKLHNFCVVRKDNGSKDVDEERSTRKRSSWGSTEHKYSSPSSTFFIVVGICIICVGFGFFLKKFKRVEGKRRYRKRKRESRSPSSGKSYERLPMTENGNQVRSLKTTEKNYSFNPNIYNILQNSNDIIYSSSEDDTYTSIQANSKVYEDRRRLMASLESGINSTEA